MFNRIVIRRRGRQEGESPFWISFSDLMTALMVLFLLVMAVTLISVTRDVSAGEQRKIEREAAINQVMQTIRERSRAFPDVVVGADGIDLGEILRFDSRSAGISPAGARFLRSYLPVLLQARADAPGRAWIRHIVVEGFTDQDGTYLYNLGLSMERSKQVVCALFAPPFADETPLSDAQKRQLRELFLVGGYSYNSMKASKEASRRVELKIDFRALDEPPEAAPPPPSSDFGQC